jgi:hypothetical protein
MRKAAHADHFKVKGWQPESYFGLDERAIVSTLANHGYEVDEGGISIQKLNDAL